MKVQLLVFLNILAIVLGKLNCKRLQIGPIVPNLKPVCINVDEHDVSHNCLYCNEIRGFDSSTKAPVLGSGYYQRDSVKLYYKENLNESNICKHFRSYKFVKKAKRIALFHTEPFQSELVRDSFLSTIFHRHWIMSLWTIVIKFLLQLHR